MFNWVTATLLPCNFAAVILATHCPAPLLPDNTISRVSGHDSEMIYGEGAAGKDLQPERFKQSHAQDVLVFVTDGDVVKENSFQLETKPAVEIDIAHVDVPRMDVDFV